MNKIFLIVPVLVVLVGGIYVFVSRPTATEDTVVSSTPTTPSTTEAVVKSVVLKEKEVTAATSTTSAIGEVKEFSMTSYYDEKGKWFSVKEITVKKGDKVRVKVTNTKGFHDFVIDEYAVALETPANKEVAVEFVADKVGTFVYYCSKPGHRAGGQWGTLIVTE